MSFVAKNYFLYGKHAVLAALKNPERKIIKGLCISDFWQNPDFKKYLKLHHFEEKTRQELDKLLGTNSIHQGIALLVEPITIDDVKSLDLNRPQTIIILDQITDPQNLGSIMRSASAFNAKTIITSSKNCVKESAILAKTSSGALENIKLVEVVNINQTIDWLKKQGYWVIGLDHNANVYIHQYQAPEKLAIVLGSEGDGIRKLTKEKCDILIKIPMLQENSLDSLNVSIATSVALYEIFKQKIKTIQ